MVFSANSRNSAGTSSLGSIMPSSSGLNGALPQFQNGVSRLLLPLARRVPELDQGRGPAFQAAQIIARRIGSAFRPRPSFAMSWGYFRLASHSEECSPRGFARALNSPDAAAWLPPPPALHPLR